MARRRAATMLAIATWLAVGRASAEDGAAPAPSPGESRDPDIVVHGEGLVAPVSRRDPTVASTVVPREQLRAPGASAAEVLRGVPGVRVARRGSSTDLSTAAIRGASSAQTPVYLAGVRLNDDVTGAVDLSTLPVWMMDRVEVFRGNAPATADRLGIGGAIFFEPRLTRRTASGAGGELGSFGADTEWVAGEVGDGKSGALVTVRHAQADNDFSYVDDRSGTPVTTTRRNADADTLDGWLVGRLELGPGTRLTTLANVFDREQGVPGLGAAPVTRARMRSQRALGGVSSRLPCSRGEGEERCVVELTETVLTSSLTVTDPLRELSPLGERTESRGERLGQSANLSLSPSDDVDVDLGASTSVSHLGVDRDGSAVTRARRLSVRPVASLLWRATERVDLSGVAALPCLSTEATGAPSQGCDALEPVGRVGAVGRLSESWSVRGNVGRYVRFPTLAELYGFSAVVRGNAGLSVETGIASDVGLRFAPRWRDSAWEAWADGFAFARWSSDLVAYRRSALGVVRPYNVASARALGAELSAVLRVFGLVDNQISVTLLDPRDTTGVPGNDILPFQARLVFADRLGLRWDVDQPALERATLGARVIHRASQYADQAGLVVIAAQTTVDLDASAAWLDDRIAARITVQNVGDARQFDAVGFPLPGRAVYVGGELWWF